MNLKESRKISSAVIIIISHQYLRISIAMVTSPWYTNANRKGTSRCKNIVAFCQAFSGHWVQWWGSSHLCSEINTGNQSSGLLSVGALSTLGEWTAEQLRFISPHWLTACLPKLPKPVSNCRHSIWAILALFLRNSEFPYLKSESRGELAEDLQPLPA